MENKIAEIIRARLMALEENGRCYNGENRHNQPITYWVDDSEKDYPIIYEYQTDEENLLSSDLSDDDIDDVDILLTARCMPYDTTKIVMHGKTSYSFHDDYIRVEYENGSSQLIAGGEPFFDWICIVTGHDPVEEGWEDGVGNPVCQRDDEEDD